MPYKSLHQARWAHTKAGTKALGGLKRVMEWDKSSIGLNLPEKAKPGRPKQTPEHLFAKVKQALSKNK